jgi:membrane dipeptidase
VPENPDALELHRRWIIADAHADSLMWNRDLAGFSEKGHVDFPRLREAGVKLQCFTIVTRGFPVIDGFGLFARWLGWPAHARSSEWVRCTWQLDQLEEACRRSDGAVAVAASSLALAENLAAGRLSAVIGIEGAHALEGQVKRVAELASRGVAFMSLTHLTNNELGGTSTPASGNRATTPLGREVLEAMAQAGLALDLAHASRAMLPELLEFPGRVFCSHAGVDAVHPLWRNLEDSTLRAVAQRGGVVGIIFAPQYLGGRSLGHLVRHVKHAVDVMGESGVALGSDFDGMVPLPSPMRDVRDLPKVTQALIDSGLELRIVEKVVGENLRRFFSEVLTTRAPAAATPSTPTI